MLVLIMEFKQKFIEGKVYKKSVRIMSYVQYTLASSIDYKVDEVSLISWKKDKIIELIDINLKANLKRNYLLKGTAVNYNDYRTHKFLYRKLTKKLNKIVYYICLFSVTINKDTLQHFLNRNNDKKLISVILDENNSSSITLSNFQICIT